MTKHPTGSNVRRIAINARNLRIEVNLFDIVAISLYENRLGSKVSYIVCG